MHQEVAGDASIVGTILRCLVSVSAAPAWPLSGRFLEPPEERFLTKNELAFNPNSAILHHEPLVGRAAGSRRLAGYRRARQCGHANADYGLPEEWPCRGLLSGSNSHALHRSHRSYFRPSDVDALPLLTASGARTLGMPGNAGSLRIARVQWSICWQHLDAQPVAIAYGPVKVLSFTVILSQLTNHARGARLASRVA
jgi:hypothetical protein